MDCYGSGEAAYTLTAEDGTSYSFITDNDGFFQTLEITRGIYQLEPAWGHHFYLDNDEERLERTYIGNQTLVSLDLEGTAHRLMGYTFPEG